MNLLLFIDAVKSQFVYFSETKSNILFDGTFTKVNYCNDFFTMYGVHIYMNNVNLETISRIENEILNAYSNYVNKPLIKNLKLVDDVKLVQGSQLKISGIWENNMGEVGLSYKIMC
jgi:hypothetical protein